MPPEALAPARFPDASALDAASVSDEEAFLARARETAMEKLRRRRRVQKRREEKTAVASFRPIAGGEKKAVAERRAREDRPVHSNCVVSIPKRHVPRLRLRGIVTPGRLVAAARGDGAPLRSSDDANALESALSVASRDAEGKNKNAGVTAAAAVGDAILCGTEDGDVVAYCTRPDDRDRAAPFDRVTRKAALSCPGACGDAGPVRLIRPVDPLDGGEKEKTAPSTARACVVAYDSGAWCVFAVRARDENSAPTETESDADDDDDDDDEKTPSTGKTFRLALVAACPPHVAFSDAYKYRKRAPWAPPRPPSLGAALVDAKGETLFVASPVVGDANVYAWDIGLVSRSRLAAERDGANLRSRADVARAAPISPADAGSLAAMRAHADKVTCLAFLDARETRVVSGGNDKALVEWRRENDRDENENARPRESTWVAAKRVLAPGGAIRALCVSARGSTDAARVYTAGSDGAVRAWEVSSETGFVLLRTFLGGHGGFGVRVFAVRLPVPRVSAAAETRTSDASDATGETDADGFEEVVLSGCEGVAGGYWVEGDGSLKLWRAADGRCAQTVRVQKGDISSIVDCSRAESAPRDEEESDQDGDENGAETGGVVASFAPPREKNRNDAGGHFVRLAVASTDGTVAHFDLGTERAAPPPGKVAGKGDAETRAGARDGDGRPASFTWTRGFL